MSGIATTKPNAAGPAGIAYNLMLLLILVVGTTVAAGYGLDSVLKAKTGQAGTVPIVVNVAGRELLLPPGWLEQGAATGPGFQTQVDFTVPLEIGLANPVPIDVSIVPRSRVQPSAEMLDTVYLHQFAPETLSGPVGLVGKPMRPGSGLAGETIWYDPLAASPFVARCLAALETDQPDTCLRTIGLSRGLAVVMTFPANALAGWRQFDPALARMLADIGAL